MTTTTTKDVASEGSQSSPTTQSATDKIDNSNKTPKIDVPNIEVLGETSTSTDYNNDINNPNMNTAIAQEDESVESTYHLKWVQWNSGKIPIVMQSKNGPCPLIATINVLLLREKVKLPNLLEQITADQLFTYLGECIMDCVPPDELQNDESAILNLEQNVHDAIEILPKLRTGLDVNIRFTGITDFEYTPECIIFDLLRIPLYHGWLCDPDLYELKRAIGNQSYNQLVDNIITNKNSLNPEMQTKVLIAEEFLERTASQLTQHGLNELKSQIKDNEIGILFRNNHFLTLLKRGSEIYTLVTDHGYLTEENIIWETLDNIEGAGRFFDSNFEIVEMSNKQATVYVNNEQKSKLLQQMEMDFLLALSLREDEGSSELPQEQEKGDNIKPTRRNDELVRNKGSNFDDDFELAKRLQAEEEALYQAAMQKESSNKQVQLHKQQQPNLVDNRPTSANDDDDDDYDENNLLKQRSNKPNSHTTTSTEPIVDENYPIPSTTKEILSEPLKNSTDVVEPILNMQESEQLSDTWNRNSANYTKDTAINRTTPTYSEVTQQQQQYHPSPLPPCPLPPPTQQPPPPQQQQQQPIQHTPSSTTATATATTRHRHRNEKNTRESNCIVN